MKLLALALLLAVPAAQAQMYKCTEGGKTRYSDKPITDCKSASTIAAPPTSSAPAPAGSAGKAPPAIAKKYPPPLPPNKGAAKKGTPSLPQQTAKAAAPTEHDKKYANAQCRELKEEEAWLLGPRGAKVEGREARLGQVRQAMAGCR
jgi:Domain of unknown function (DUF4124)